MRSIRQIPLHLIKPSPFNVRQRIDTVSLTRSMGSLGQIEPIRVRPEGDGYEIRTGMRRFLALREAGATHVDALVVEGSDDEVVTEQWDENEERAEYTDYERALKIRQMLDVLGTTQTKLAGRIGKTQGWVAQQLRVLRLDGVITTVILQKMTEWQARAVLGAPEEFWPQIAAYIEKICEELGEMPSAASIADYAEQLQLNRDIEDIRRSILLERKTAGVDEPSVLEQSQEGIHGLVEEHGLSGDALNDEEPESRQGAADPILRDSQIIAALSRMVGEPVEGIIATLVEVHGITDEEAHEVFELYKETFPDICTQGPREPEQDELEGPSTVEEYIADVLRHNPEVDPRELAKVAAEAYGVSEAYTISIIERTRGRRRGRPPRHPNAAIRPTATCPLCGQANAEKNRLLMILEEYQENDSDIALVQWLREVLL